MTNVSNHTIKINRAVAQSDVGQHPATATAMLAAIPADVIAALPSRLIAQMIDACDDLAATSKAIALRDALSDGGVWCDKSQEFVEICNA